MAANKSVLRAEADAQEWVPVASSNVDAIAYAADFARLYVRFLDGKLYVYHGVGPSVWDRFRDASSKGKFLWSVVRNNGRDDVYPYDPLD